MSPERCFGSPKGLSIRYQDKRVRVPYAGMEKKKEVLTTADKLVLIAGKAGADRKLKFTSLIHLLNSEYLYDCYKELKRGKAAGIDGRTRESYTDEQMQEAIRELIGLLKVKRYTPSPVRRVSIRKDNGTMRPLGIPTVIDKVMQKGVTKILEAIYEPTFLPLSYGYRPGRDAHACIKEINHMIMQGKVNYMIEADIEGFFDHVDHQWMMRCLDQRVADPNFKWLIARFLKAGVMHEGRYEATGEGTPQGGIISPVLANIYLHYILDLWFMKEQKQQQGYAQLVRYADDFVIGVQHRQEGEKIKEELGKRLETFGLRLSKEKTRIMEFGRFAGENKKRRGERKPDTFDFLGLTHYCTKTKDGRFMVRVKTSRKRINRNIGLMKTWLKQVRNILPIERMWPIIASKLQGHYNYYGVSGNFESIQRYYRKTQYLVYKWMNRRSQKKTWNWDGFLKYLETYPLPKPKLTYALYNTW